MCWNVYFSLSTDLLFPELPEDPMHDIQVGISARQQPPARRASARRLERCKNAIQKHQIPLLEFIALAITAFVCSRLLRMLHAELIGHNLVDQLEILAQTAT